MAVAGIYSVTIKAPFGDRKSQLVLIEKGSYLSGEWSNENGTATLTNCKAEGNTAKFDTVATTVFGKMDIHVNCTMVNDEVTGTVKLALGEFPLTGKRINSTEDKPL